MPLSPFTSARWHLWHAYVSGRRNKHLSLGIAGHCTTECSWLLLLYFAQWTHNHHQHRERPTAANQTAAPFVVAIWSKSTEAN